MEFPLAVEACTRQSLSSAIKQVDLAAPLGQLQGDTGARESGA